MDPWIFFILVAYAGMSFAAFVAYAVDKRRAVRGGRRLRESTLQLLALLGGWPGALAAQRTLRHKTRKRGFQLVFWLIVAANLAGLIALAWFARPA